MVTKRKKYFVDRSVQGAIVLRLLVHCALFVFTTGAFLYFVELLVGAPRDAGKNLLSRHGPTILSALVLGPIFLRDLCKLTNRFAGPMMRLRRAMRDLADGREVGFIKFRDGDMWQELAVDFNRVVERIQTSEAALGDGVLEDAHTPEMVTAIDE